ncbi:(d)CMP kinase [Fodinibius halophilus]|uniref:Cytidylate kinase n=1 Tax=Fodinibius halophilus TaxID=1736908 RepID=A0A6M1T6X1_9BACT|nr:(d)CMP kinase [Fodinibius halophilus]NGP87771.1 (d)CMP kinase [Fodinibius halophilus]
MIIVIDGPAGSGKSSTARAVANRLSIEYLDSGALYRAVTLVYLEAGCEEEKFFSLLQKKDISFYYRDQLFHIAIDGSSVTDDIRTAAVAENVSEVAAMPDVRAFVNDLMRDVVKEGIYIAEGRDLGTAVFPDAELKFYMWADLDERAQRRFDERKDKNPDLTFEQVKESIAQRDQKDASREADPLKKADDAIEIDTTAMTFEQQVDEICWKVKQRIED